MEHDESPDRGEEIELIIARITSGIYGETRDSVCARYLHALALMTDREFARFVHCLSEHNNRQLFVVDQKVQELQRNTLPIGLVGKYVCLLFDTALWSLWFSEPHMVDELTTRIIVDNTMMFFDPESTDLGEGVHGTDSWLDYSIGYMIETMVTFEHGTSASSPEHLRWLTENVRALQPHRQVITERRDISREFCDIVLGNASRVLSEGIL